MPLGYWRATLSAESVRALEGALGRPDYMAPPGHYHVTLAFGVERNLYAGHEGLSFVVVVDTAKFNDRVVALPVDLTGLPVNSTNPVPHITWGLAKGVEPNESNAMLAGAHRVMKFPPQELHLTVEFLQWL